jgi:hypothetical protein
MASSPYGPDLAHIHDEGFGGWGRDSDGALRLPKGHAAFIARKPST